jgi:hypothetical protein
MTWGGPMKHAFAGALHLAWHRRAERRRPFHRPQAAGPDRRSNAPLGETGDFTWNQLLGFDACVQCGK